ncbi:hypothetical protein H0H81_002162 [Sphagnurus paluster]|uniref:Uncharacterized protein n=1 Tax=Sphagnurus paluster TaxID=117069 RepID=A0A9P7FSZ8_9AGAR|nr:hypothetical protein H0H81_002162 [Sphagnurus paluster]
MWSKRQAPNNALVEQWIDAYWIWTSEGVGLHAPGGDRPFRTTWTPSPRVSVLSMNVLATADDYFTLYLNGQVVSDTRWEMSTGATVWATAVGSTASLNLSSSLVFAVLATNNPATGGAPAGLLIAIQLSLSDGSTSFVTTGNSSSWVTTTTVPADFQLPNTSVAGWVPASVISQNGADAPWGAVQLPSTLTVVSLSASATPTSSSGPSPSLGTKVPSSSKTTPVGAIVGGVVGGTSVLLLLTISLLWYCRKRERAIEIPNLSAPPTTMEEYATSLPPVSTVFPPNPSFTPFMLQTPREDGLRSKVSYDHEAARPVEVFGVAATESSGAESNAMINPAVRGNSVGDQAELAEELRTTMNRLQQLTEELNRGVAVPPPYEGSRDVS